MLENYQEIYQGEIFAKSQCIELENSLMDFFQKNLIHLGYNSIDLGRKIWKKNNKTVVISLVDSVSSHNYESPVSKLFDTNAIVITDNQINVSTDYQVLQLPKSFFGIYYYQPDNNNYNPIKDINLSVNRLDAVRQTILFELISSNSIDNIFDNLNISFNCFMHERGLSQKELIENFIEVWKQICYRDFKYLKYYNKLLSNHIPIKNHNMSVEEAMLSAHVNMIIETYSEHNTIALSEKTFRALVTAAPWTLYAGKNAVSFLKNSGFDVLDDLVDHSYNSNSIDPIDYVRQSVKIAKNLKQIPRLKLIERCSNAARHNQILLKNMRQSWPKDFAVWWADVVDHIL
jgi:hypothetical protein